MKGKIVILLLSLIALGSYGSMANYKAKKKHKDGIVVLEAYSQKTVPGIPKIPARTQFHFIVVWDYATYPQTIFWRGESGWETCNIARAHKAHFDAPVKGKKVEYNTEIVTSDKIHRGDTLQLVSVPGGKFPVPAEIPADAKNMLYYKTGGSGWLSVPVKVLRRNPM